MYIFPNPDYMCLGAWAIIGAIIITCGFDYSGYVPHDRTEKQMSGILCISPIDCPSPQVSEFMAVLVLGSPNGRFAQRNAKCRADIHMPALPFRSNSRYPVLKGPSRLSVSSIMRPHYGSTEWSVYICVEQRMVITLVTASPSLSHTASAFGASGQLINQVSHRHHYYDKTRRFGPS